MRALVEAGRRSPSGWGAGTRCLSCPCRRTATRAPGRASRSGRPGTCRCRGRRRTTGRPARRGPRGPARARAGTSRLGPGSTRPIVELDPVRAQQALERLDPLALAGHHPLVGCTGFLAGKLVQRSRDAGVVRLVVVPVDAHRRASPRGRTVKRRSAIGVAFQVRLEAFGEVVVIELGLCVCAGCLCNGTKLALRFGDSTLRRLPLLEEKEHQR